MSADPLWPSVKFACHCDDPAMADLRGATFAVTGTGALSSGASKSGGKSFYQAPGANNFIEVTPTAALALASAQNWCIECWLYPVEGDSTLSFFSTRQNSTSVQILISNGAGTLSASTYNSSGTPLTITGGALPTGSWSHAALVRDGANLTCYTNGVAGTPVAVGTANLIGAYDNLLHFGGDIARMVAFGDARSFRGYMDEMRITVGDSRYTANFTPLDTFNDAPKLIGTVRDSANALCARTVRAYRRSDGLLAGSTTSDGTTGAFSIDALDTSAHTIIALDNGTPDENAQIFDSVIPV